MSYCFISCNCIACGAFITINPTYCPSLTVNGKKEPICKSCFNRWNQIHRPNNPIDLHPEAYKPLPEEDLGKVCTDSRYMGSSETYRKPVEHPHSGDIDFEIQIYLDRLNTTRIVRGHLEHYLRQLDFSSEEIEEAIDNQIDVGFITLKGGV